MAGRAGDRPGRVHGGVRRVASARALGALVLDGGTVRGAMWLGAAIVAAGVAMALVVAAIDKRPCAGR